MTKCFFNLQKQTYESITISEVKPRKLFFYEEVVNIIFRGLFFIGFLARARCRATCAAVAYAATTSCTALFVTAPCNVRITMMIMILIIMIMMMIIMIMMMIIMVLIVKGDVPCGRCCRRWKIENEPWTWNIACKEFDHILIKALFLSLFYNPLILLLVDFSS